MGNVSSCGVRWYNKPAVTGRQECRQVGVSRCRYVCVVCRAAVHPGGVANGRCVTNLEQVAASPQTACQHKQLKTSSTVGMKFIVTCWCAGASGGYNGGEVAVEEGKGRR